MVEEVGFLWVQGKSGLHESSRTVNNTQRDPVKKKRQKKKGRKGKYLYMYTTQLMKGEAIYLKERK